MTNSPSIFRESTFSADHTAVGIYFKEGMKNLDSWVTIRTPVDCPACLTGTARIRDNCRWLGLALPVQERRATIG